MEGVGKRRCNPHNFGDRVWCKRSAECLIDVLKRHSVCHAFQDERDGRAGATDRERFKDYEWIFADPGLLGGKRSSRRLLSRVGVYEAAAERAVDSLLIRRCLVFSRTSR